MTDAQHDRLIALIHSGKGFMEAHSIVEMEAVQARVQENVDQITEQVKMENEPSFKRDAERAWLSFNEPTKAEKASVTRSTQMPQLRGGKVGL